MGLQGLQLVPWMRAWRKTKKIEQIERERTLRKNGNWRWTDGGKNEIVAKGRER